MRAKHLKWWLAAAKRKEREEVVDEKEHPEEERTTEGPDGTGGETAESRGGDTYRGVQLGEGGGTCP